MSTRVMQAHSQAFKAMIGSTHLLFEDAYLINVCKFHPADAYNYEYKFMHLQYTLSKEHRIGLLATLTFPARWCSLTETSHGNMN